MRGITAVVLLAAGVSAGATERFVDRVQDSLPEGVRLTAMNCRGNAVVIRGESPDEARLKTFMRSMSDKGITPELHLTHPGKETDSPVLAFMLHARDAKSSGADVCTDLPDRFPVVRVVASAREPPAPCPGSRQPRRILDRQSVESIRLAGVMTREDTRYLYAIVQGSGEQVHRVRIGDRLGAEDACVLAIREDGIFVRLPGGERRIPLAAE